MARGYYAGQNLLIRIDDHSPDRYLAQGHLNMQAAGITLPSELQHRSPELPAGCFLDFLDLHRAQSYLYKSTAIHSSVLVRLPMQRSFTVS